MCLCLTLTNLESFWGWTGFIVEVTADEHEGELLKELVALRCMEHISHRHCNPIQNNKLRLSCEEHQFPAGV